jgi:uncharacterized UBP type Zn finger protein
MTCEHLVGLRPIDPHTSEGCEDCLAIGGRWVHLRMCMECGHVGCCDSSPNRHATAHYNGTGHGVVQSFEPGEDWAFCYADDEMIRSVPAEAVRSYGGDRPT